MSSVRNIFVAYRDFNHSVGGFKLYGLLFLLGALGAFAQAPYYFLFLLPLSFTSLVWHFDKTFLMNDKRKRRTFALGWWFAFGYLYLGLYWMAFSFFHHATSTGHLFLLGVIGFVSVAGLAGFIALFYGFAALFIIKFWSSHWSRIFIFTVFWSLAEYARGHLLTGLPWNLTGQAFAVHPVLLQLAAYIGPYGLSLIVILLSALPAVTLPVKRDAHFTFSHVAAFCFIFSFIAFVGIIRLSGSPTDYRDDLNIQIIQPNITMEDKINPLKFADNFLEAYNLSGGPDLQAQKPESETYVIWPENAAYAYFQQDVTALDMLSKQLPVNSQLLTGASRIEDKDPENFSYFNSFFVIAERDLPIEEKRELQELGEEFRAHQIVAHYDKHHLAPFGEYVPLKGVFSTLGIDKIVPLNDVWSRGEGPDVINLGKSSVAPIICYETIFAGRMYPKGERPDWIATVTNDAWFGDSVGPKQHLAQAQFRAVETGLPLIRSANTGISAIIDPYGRIVEKLPLSQKGALFSALPHHAEETVYGRLGDWVYAVLLFTILTIGIYYRKSSPKG